MRSQNKRRTPAKPNPHSNGHSQRAVKLPLSVSTQEHHYVLKEEGLYIKEGGRFRWKCAAAFPVATTFDVNKGTYGVLVEFENLTGQLSSATIPRRELLNPRAVAAILLEQGFPVLTEHKAAFHLGTFISVAKPMLQIRVVGTGGWVHVDTEEVEKRGPCFVLGSHVYGPNVERCRIKAARKDEGFAKRGTRADWREHVGRLCAGNELLVLAVSAAFAAPLHERAGIAPGGLHFGGDTSTGKSTVLDVAASLYGPPQKLRGNWLATPNGLVALAEKFNDLPLFLDEIGQSAPTETARLIYDLLNGIGKARAYSDGSAQPIARFRTTVLSTGERSTAEHLERAGLSIARGQEIRLLTLLADEEYGMFRHLHGYPDGGQFAIGLGRNAAAYYGAAGRAFIRYLAENPEQVGRWLAEKLPKYTAELEGLVAELAPDAAEKRVIARLALVAFAGALATRRGLTGWQPAEAKRAIAYCLRKWMMSRRSDVEEKTEEVLSRLKAFFEGNSGRFVRVDRATRPLPSDHAGYRFRHKGEKVFLVELSCFKDEICKGMDLKRSETLLQQAGFLIVGRQKKTKQILVRGADRKRSFYVIRRTILR